jgi:hypothetical protein
VKAKSPVRSSAGERLSRRQMLSACASFLAIASELPNDVLAGPVQSCTIRLGPLGQDRAPEFIGATKDDFVQLEGYVFFPRERFAEESAFRLGVQFDFRGDEAKLPLRRRVQVQTTLLDANNHPLITVNREFLDRRAVARESLNDWMTRRRGGISSTLGTNYRFQRTLLARLNAVELRFTELAPTDRLADRPFE